MRTKPWEIAGSRWSVHEMVSDLSVDDLEHSRHVFMAAAAKYIAKKSEGPGLAGYKTQCFDGAGFDIGSQLKRREFEAVVTVLTADFQDHRHSFFDGDLTWLEFKCCGGDSDNLFVARYRLRGGSNNGLLVQ